MAKQLRYKLWISFHNSLPLMQEFSNKKEAETYKSIIDHTVEMAWLSDSVKKSKDIWK